MDAGRFLAGVFKAMPDDSAAWVMGCDRYRRSELQDVMQAIGARPSIRWRGTGASATADGAYEGASQGLFVGLLRSAASAAARSLANLGGRGADDGRGDRPGDHRPPRRPTSKLPTTFVWKYTVRGSAGRRTAPSTSAYTHKSYSRPRSAASSAVRASRTAPAGNANRWASRRAMVAQRGGLRFDGLVVGQLEHASTSRSRASLRSFTAAL